VRLRGNPTRRTDDSPEHHSWHPACSKDSQHRPAVILDGWQSSFPFWREAFCASRLPCTHNSRNGKKRVTTFSELAHDDVFHGVEELGARGVGGQVQRRIERVEFEDVVKV